MALVMAVALLAHSMAFDPDREPTPSAPDPEPEVAEVVEDVTPAPVLSPRSYLYAEYPSLAPKLDCMIRRESTWFAGAVSGPYVGLAQFDYPTWLSTPQGKAGASRYDPYASIDAMAWGVVHLGYSRWPVTSRLC